MYISSKRDVRTLPLDKLLVNYTKALAEATSKATESVHDYYNKKVVEASKTTSEYSYEGDNETLVPFNQSILEDRIAKEKDLAKKEVVSSFCKYYAVSAGSNWIMPQIASIVAEMPLTKTAEGKINTLEYVKSFGRDDWYKGLWILCTHALRGDMMQKQYAPENRSYSALVPLLLAPHKRFSNIKYSQWDIEGLERVLDPNLYEAIQYGNPPDLSFNEKMQIRMDGLTVRSGAKAGTTRNAQTTHKLYGLSGELHNMPWLCQVMYFQIWCAHPANRGDLMILDWQNLDHMPEPLEPPALFKDTQNIYVAPATNTYDLPW